MAQISSINFANINQFRQISTLNCSKTKIKYAQSPIFNKNLQTDTVSFKGTNGENTDNIDINKLILENSKRRTGTEDFSYDDRLEIKYKVTEKNKKFLPDLLTLNDKALSAKNIKEILEYINRPDTYTSEFSEVLKNFKNLDKRINENVDYRPSALPMYIKEISSQGITDILKSNALLPFQKNNFNTFSEAYNNTVRIFDDQVKRYCARNNTNISNFIVNRKAAAYMKECFANFLVLGTIFDRSVLNELVYNRGQYINDIYMPRLRTLSQNDLKILRKVQTDAVTDKENKSDDIVSYEISLDDKISMLNLLHLNREIINAGYEGVNVENYLRPVNSNNQIGNIVVDFQNLKIDLMDKVLRRIGINKNTVDEYMSEYRKTYAEEPDLKTHRDKFWDVKYVHLLNAKKGSLLRDIIINSTNGNFNDYLYKTGSVADVNRKNKELFEKAGINYDKWLSPTISPISEKFVAKGETKEKTFTVKNWNRNPFESLFDGNYTTCCTGLDKNHGESFLKYITNTCTTTLEVRTEKNKVIAMSRLLMAEIDGRLSMVIENIEVNNKMAKHYLYDDKTKYKFREMIFDYARAFAKNINKTDEEIPVYFSSKYYKVKDIEKGLRPGQKYTEVKLIGKYPDTLYINSYGALRDATTIVRDEGDEFGLNLSNVTRKAKPVYSEEKNDFLSESDYNYADTENYNR